ncbi:MAG: L,D-transpeptidase family protein [Halobacteria archaeon]|nr:L,D-transpeptidase family protein [Halobacteria archaeon]
MIKGAGSLRGNKTARTNTHGSFLTRLIRLVDIPAVEPPALPRDRSAWSVLTAIFLAVIAQYGCSSIPEWWFFPQSPTRNDRFLLPPAGTDVVGNVQIAIARYKDTLPDIARHYDLGYNEIVAANPSVDPWLPGKGTQVVLPTQFILPKSAREGLVLNLETLRLFYYPKPKSGEPAVVITHPIGIGREGWQTPQGKARITQKVENPSWTVPASVRKEHAQKGDPLPPVVPPGPDNPLGGFAMRLSLPSYLIHGTNKPWGVGMRVSHGCVRLYPEDIVRLFPEVPVGTKVHIVNQPYVAGWLNGYLYLEAHPPLAEDAKRWGDSLKPMEKVVRAKAADFLDAVDWDKARRIAREARGIPIPTSPNSLEFKDVLARARRVPSVPRWAQVDSRKVDTNAPNEAARRRIKAEEQQTSDSN